MQVQSLGQEDPLDNGMATHSSILAQRIPWREEPWLSVHGVAESDTRQSVKQSFHLIFRIISITFQISSLRCAIGTKNSVSVNPNLLLLCFTCCFNYLLIYKALSLYLKFRFLQTVFCIFVYSQLPGSQPLSETQMYLRIQIFFL